MENGNDIENENNKLPNNMKLFNERSPDMSDLNDDKEPKIPISNIKAGEFNLELEYINNSKDMQNKVYIKNKLTPMAADRKLKKEDAGLQLSVFNIMKSKK
jgi:hypothetical protein